MGENGRGDATIPRPDLKNVRLPAHRVGDRLHDRLSGNRHPRHCSYCGGHHPGGEESCYDKKNGKLPGRRELQCSRCSGYGHNEEVCPTEENVPTDSAPTVPSRRANVKDVRIGCCC